MVLFIHGVQPTSVFGLNGVDENSATFALGWTLEESSHFLSLFGKAVFGKSLDKSDVAIALQKHAADGGYASIPNYGLLAESTIPPHARLHHQIISAVGFIGFAGTAALLAYMRPV